MVIGKVSSPMLAMNGSHLSLEALLIRRSDSPGFRMLPFLSRLALP